MKYNAEFEIDKVIKEKFFPQLSNGILVEVGAAHPELLSFSKYFRDEGWRCISIEPNPFFVNQHRLKGHEIYQYACADYNQDNADFEISIGAHEEYTGLTYESFSSIKIKQDYINKDGEPPNRSNIKVNIRTLNHILTEINLQQDIDILIVDVEGWELEVVKGLSLQKYKPKIIILENYLHKKEYNEFMSSLGYQFDSSVLYNYIYTEKK